MSNPGYVMVDATGLDVSQSETQTVDGLYEKLETAMGTGKAILLTGVVNGESEVTPSFVTVTEGAGVGFTIGSFTALVTSDDEVSPVGA